jgi:hypothetical protein
LAVRTFPPKLGSSSPLQLSCRHLGTRRFPLSSLTEIFRSQCGCVPFEDSCLVGPQHAVSKLRAPQIRSSAYTSQSVCGKGHRRLRLDVRSNSFLGFKEGSLVGAGAEPGVMDFSGPHWDGSAFPKDRKCELIRGVPVRGIVFLVDLSIQCNQSKSNVTNLNPM